MAQIQIQFITVSEFSMRLRLLARPLSRSVTVIEMHLLGQRPCREVTAKMMVMSLIFLDVIKQRRILTAQIEIVRFPSRLPRL